MLPRTQDLLEQYRNLRALLANLEGRGLAELVDALLPAASDECGVLREVALPAIPDLEDVSALFERIKTHVTQDENIARRIAAIRNERAHKSSEALCFLLDTAPLNDMNTALRITRLWLQAGH